MRFSRVYAHTLRVLFWIDRKVLLSAGPEIPHYNLPDVKKQASSLQYGFKFNKFSFDL